MRIVSLRVAEALSTSPGLSVIYILFPVYNNYFLLRKIRFIIRYDIAYLLLPAALYLFGKYHHIIINLHNNLIFILRMKVIIINKINFI